MLLIRYSLQIYVKDNRENHGLELRSVVKELMLILAGIVVLILSLYVLSLTAEIRNLETRFLAQDIELISICVFVAVVAWLPKENRKHAAKTFPLLLLVAFILLLVSWMQYAGLRPNAPFSIVITTSTYFLLLGFIGFVTILPMKRLDVFGAHPLLEKLGRFIAVLYCYSVIFGFTILGLGYGFSAIVRAASASETPEIGRFVIPTIAAALLISFRLSSRIKNIAWDTLHRISEDAIFGSFAILGYVQVVRFVGVNPLFPFGLSSADYIDGAGVGVAGLFVEWCILLLKRRLPPLPGQRLGNPLLPYLLREFFKKQRQVALDEWMYVPRTDNRSALRQWFESRITIPDSLKGRRAKIAFFGSMLICLVIVVSLSQSQTAQTFLVPGWKVDLSIVAGPLKGATILLSDQVEFRTAPETFAVPISMIRLTNSSFLAPLNSRYATLNSSEYRVLQTGTYLLVNITMIPVLLSGSSSLFPSSPFNQTSNPLLSYIGFYRDVEVYYALFKSGYTIVISICQESTSGFITTDSKLIFAEAPDGRRALVSIQRKGETIPTDQTVVQSLDTITARTIVDLISSARVGTAIQIVASNPTSPFRIG